MDESGMRGLDLTITLCSETVGDKDEPIQVHCTLAVIAMLIGMQRDA